MCGRFALRGNKGVLHHAEQHTATPTYRIVQMMSEAMIPKGRSVAAFYILAR